MKYQKGYTFVELMIGLLIGLIVLSAVIYSFLTTLRSSRDVINSSVLNNEVMAVLDLMSGEFRRIGYNADSSTSPAGGYYKITSGGSESASGNCILYIYDRDSVGLSTATYSGFRLDDNTIKYADGLGSTACISPTWGTSVVDTRVNVSSLSITAVSEALPSTDSMITLEVGVSANVKQDADWKLENINKLVKLRNHYE
jgi:prepilin peptidase dependent protein B